MQIKTSCVMVASALALLLSVAPRALAATFTATVASVTDGDTITVMHNGAREKVIFYGIDCPELGQPFGPEAKEFTDHNCFKKDVTIEEHGQDPRGRTIAVVTLADGTNLNQELLKQGLAWWSDKYAPKAADLKQLFLTAKAAKKGLWSDASPIAPWTFRNGERSTQATIIKTK